MSEVFDTAYIPDRDSRGHRLASPAFGSDSAGLEGLAPALIVAAEYDRLRDEASAYGRRLDAAGSLAEYIEVPDVDHGYNIMWAAPQAADVTRRIYARITEHVVRATSGF